MKTTERDDTFADDPLAVRISRIQDPPVSEELMTRVLSGQRTRRRRRIRRSYLIGAVAVLAALLTALAISPVGATAGVGVLQHFGIMEGSPKTLQHPGPNDCAIYAGAPNTTKTTFTRNGATITEWTRTAPKGCGTQPLRMWSVTQPLFDLERAQAVVSFRIRTASWLPDGLRLQGVRMDLEPPNFSTYGHDATLIYRPSDSSSGPSISIEEQPGTPNGGSGVPSSSVEDISVNGHPAVYVHGNYDSKDPQGPAVWNPNADVSELSWQADGITFDIRAAGLHLSRSDLVRVADSVQ